MDSPTDTYVHHTVFAYIIQVVNRVLFVLRTLAKISYLGVHGAQNLLYSS